MSLLLSSLEVGEEASHHCIRTRIVSPHRLSYLEGEGLDVPVAGGSLTTSAGFEGGTTASSSFIPSSELSLV